MYFPGVFSNIIVFITICSINDQCFATGNIIDNSNDILNEIDIKLLELVVDVDKETTELEEWRGRVAVLEGHIEEVRERKAEVLGRQKRKVADPRLGMFVGKPGLPGKRGTPGVPGAIGRRGLKGLKGLSGSPGLRGPMGPFGPPGWGGPPGFIGAVGIKGEKGVAGFDGLPGILGAVGPFGINGEHGRLGQPGYPGHVGFIGMPGPPGLRGDLGSVGLVGEPGERGGVGVAGPVGLYGEPGPMGEVGFMGPHGELGQKGLKGERGMSGDIGDWGPVGRPGPVYDPYVGMFNAKTPHQAPGMLVNCTDVDDENGTTPNCETYDEMPVYSYTGKKMPLLGHPPPGAHVMPAQHVVMKSPMAMAYGPPKTSYQQDNEQMSLDNLQADFDDKDDTDILSEDEYRKLMNLEMVDDPSDVIEQGTDKSVVAE